MTFPRVVSAAAVLTACGGCWNSHTLEIDETREQSNLGSRLQLGVGLQTEFAAHVAWHEDRWLWQDWGDACPEALEVSAQPQGLLEVLPAAAYVMNGQRLDVDWAPNADLIHFTPTAAGPGELTFDDPSADDPVTVAFDVRTVDAVRWGFGAGDRAEEPTVFVGSTVGVGAGYEGAGRDLLGTVDLGLIAPGGSETTLDRYVDPNGVPHFTLAVGPAPHAFMVTTPALDAPFTVHAVGDDAILGIYLPFFQADGEEVQVGASKWFMASPLDALGFVIRGTPQATPSVSVSDPAIASGWTSSGLCGVVGVNPGDTVATITWAGATLDVAIHVTP